MKQLLIFLFSLTVCAQSEKDLQIKDTLAPKLENIK